jgi:prolyl 4-hydroxylase
MAVTQTIIKIILSFFLICVFIFTYIFDIFSYEHYIEPEYGFASVSDEYIMPKVYENFITKEEAEYVLKKSKDKFAPSKVHMGVNTDIRNSYTAWISKYDKVVKNIVTRVCQIEGLPFDNAEHLQVVRYKPNEYYKKHFDTQYMQDDTGICDSVGHRVITMLIYLTDDFEEGATRFTFLKKDIKPSKYSGILFHSLGKTNKKCHPYSRHAGLPVKTGEKYVANVWIRQNKFTQSPLSICDPYYYHLKSFLERNKSRSEVVDTCED